MAVAGGGTLRTMRLPLSVVAAVLLAGCASLGQETWSKPGVTRPIVARDVVDCEREALIEPDHGESCAKRDVFPPRNDVVFDACMRARGYERLTASGL
jgi:hypothetical protein